MVHLFQNLYFALKPLNFFRIINRLLLNNFNRTLKFADFVNASAYFSKWPLAELLFEFVVIAEMTILLGYKINLRNFVHVGAAVTWTARTIASHTY